MTERNRNVVMKKVFNFDNLHSKVDTICTTTAIVDLYRDRDNHSKILHSDIIDIIQMLYIC